MSVNVFGYKMSIISLLFFAIVIILISHTYSGCCNNPYALIEGYEGGASEEHKDKKDVKHKKGTKDKKGAKDKEPKSDKEGFTGANTNYGQSSMYDIGLDVPVNTSNWSQPNMVVRPGQPLDPAVQKFLSRPHQPLPLPSGEMDMFFNTPFSPECCPNTYSNSSGCACMTGNQYNYLITRGGNNVPYSEY